MTVVNEFSPIIWKGDHLSLIDQLQLPTKEIWMRCNSWDECATAIENMVVRGAPAIGITAAFGICLSIHHVKNESMTRSTLLDYLDQVHCRLANTRPTAVNLFWALRRMRHLWQSFIEEYEDGQSSEFIHRLFERCEQEAISIQSEDRDMCIQMGQYGAELLPLNAKVLTHCNAGALATGGHGTALGVIRSAHKLGKLQEVFADETRPYLQGARLTTWELDQDGIPVSLICDNMAASLMAAGSIDVVIVGADRVAANGDVANKIGTYGLAVLAKAHNIPFYVAAPTSTIDLDTESGADIEIEHRSADEVRRCGNQEICLAHIPALHPAFDVTPAHLISAIITECGVLRYPYLDGLKEQVNRVNT